MAVSVATERVRSLGSSGHSAFQGPLVTLTAAMALQRFPFDVAALLDVVVFSHWTSGLAQEGGPTTIQLVFTVSYNPLMLRLALCCFA